MKDYIKKLEKSVRQELIHKQREYIQIKAVEYGLAIETVQNLLAKNYLQGGDDNSFKKLLVESQRLSYARKTSGTIRNDYDLNICNHAVIVSVLNDTEVKEKNSKNALNQDNEDYDGVHFDKEEERIPVKWKDVLILSAVYTVISEATAITDKDIVEITIDRVHQILYPDRKISKFERNTFLKTVQETISRFSQICGYYKFQGGDTYPFNSDFFFDGHFEAAGNGTFRKSILQNLTEAQKRRIVIKSEYLKGKRLTWDSQGLKTYLIYRHELAEHPKTQIGRNINIDSMTKKLGFPIQRNILKHTLSVLQEEGLFHGHEITARSITWKHKDEGTSKCYIKMNDENGNKQSLPPMDFEAEERNEWLNVINNVNISAKLTKDGKRLDRTLYAIYKGNYQHGGRLYVTGTYSYQRLSGKERQQCKIDGEPVCEIDFSCLHPRMLYAQKNIDFRDDAYDFYEDRSIAKKAMQIVINSASREIARQAIAKEINPENYKAFGTLRQADSIISAIEKKHEKIKEDFYDESTWGILQFIDSRIIITAVKSLADEGIPAYPIHDSILCKTSDMSKCVHAMSKAYEDELKIKPMMTVTMQGIKMAIKEF